MRPSGAKANEVMSSSIVTVGLSSDCARVAVGNAKKTMPQRHNAPRELSVRIFARSGRSLDRCFSQFGPERDSKFRFSNFQFPIRLMAWDADQCSWSSKVFRRE